MGKLVVITRKSNTQTQLLGGFKASASPTPVISDPRVSEIQSAHFEDLGYSIIKSDLKNVRIQKL